MPFNGSGVFTPLITFIPDSDATAGDQNTQDEDFASGLTNCLTRDGQSTPTAALSMNGFALQNVGAPVGSGDAVNLLYLTSIISAPAPIIPVVGGTSDVITGAFTPPVTALVNGSQALVRFTAENTTTTPTFQADSTPAAQISMNGGQQLLIGSIAGAAAWGLLIWDASLGQWSLTNPAPVEAPGVVKMLAMQTIPAGWLECKGTSLTVAAYPQLFAAIGYTYGGSGANFNIPDARGLVPRAWDDGAGVDPSRVFGSTQQDALQAHTHTYNNPAGSFNFTTTGGSFAYTSVNSAATSGVSSPGRTATETRMKNIAWMFIIKT